MTAKSAGSLKEIFLAQLFRPPTSQVSPAKFEHYAMILRIARCSAGRRLIFANAKAASPTLTHAGSPCFRESPLRVIRRTLHSRVTHHDDQSQNGPGPSRPRYLRTRIRL